MTGDFELLKRFAESGDENAFQDLVSRHVNLVYSTALRLLNGDTHMAEDVAQKVFTDLARKAASLPKDVVLSGWLYEASRFAAANTVRGEQRRKAREQEASTMQQLSSESPDDWKEVSPHLDTAMSELAGSDRDAIVLRYFQNQDFRSIGVVLGVSDDSAQKRVSRAVERLREHLLKREISIGSTLLVGLIAANAVHAAPSNLAASLALAATKQSLGGAALAQASAKASAWTTAKIAVTAVLTALSVTGIAWYWNATIPVGGLRLPTGSRIPKISMGAAHGIILASDGSLWSWGENYLGWPVLGSGTKGNQTILRRIAEDNDWVDVSTSDSHCLALKADGTMWTWGQNLYGQLGIASSGRADSERATPVRSAPGNDWKQVAAGGSHSLALKKDGTLWAWGNNWAGQLGIGSSATEVHQVTQVGVGTNWVKIQASAIQSVGLQTDGTLWFWGSLTGSATDTNRFDVPTRISADTNWSEVGFGFFTVFAIKGDGTLWIWGRKAGIFTGGPIEILNPTPGQIGTNNDWKACSMSETFHRVLQKNDGSLWALDASDHLVVNKTSYKPVELRRIPLKKDIVAFDATGRRMTGVALTKEGELWTWGRVLGKQSGAYPRLRAHAEALGWKTTIFDGKPVIRNEPWRLSHE